jgi:hypothetical protein
LEQGPRSWGAWIEDLPGCVAVGATREECEALIADAIPLHKSLCAARAALGAPAAGVGRTPGERAYFVPYVQGALEHSYARWHDLVPVECHALGAVWRCQTCGGDLRAEVGTGQKELSFGGTISYNCCGYPEGRPARRALPRVRPGLRR